MFAHDVEPAASIEEALLPQAAAGDGGEKGPSRQRNDNRQNEYVVVERNLLSLAGCGLNALRTADYLEEVLGDGYA